VCGLNIELLEDKLSVHIVTAGLKMLQHCKDNICLLRSKLRLYCCTKFKLLSLSVLSQAALSLSLSLSVLSRRRFPCAERPQTEIARTCKHIASYGRHWVSQNLAPRKLNLQQQFVSNCVFPLVCLLPYSDVQNAELLGIRTPCLDIT
jgi:hypothetical protein